MGAGAIPADCHFIQGYFMDILEAIYASTDRAHENHQKKYPYLHCLTKDSYSREEALEMCIKCCNAYQWNKQMEYDARTNRYYKVVNNIS